MNQASRRGAILLASLLAGCEVLGVQGSGNVISESRSVGGFSAVSLEGSGQVTIAQDGTETLTITTDDNLLPFITSEVKNGELRLGTKSRIGIHSTRGIYYTVTVRDLRAVGVAGSGSIDVSDLQSERLDVSISGSASVVASGEVDELEVSISGSGHYEGEQLQSQDATVRISGSGGAVVAASKNLHSDLTGSGSIEYIGDPALVMAITGSGSVRKN